MNESDRGTHEEWRGGSEEEFRTLIEQMQEFAIFRMNVDGRPTTWNPGVRKVLGFEEQEFIGKEIVPLIFTPEDIEAGVPERELEVAAMKGSANNDRWLRRKDGTRFWASGMTMRLTGATGQLAGFSKVLRDMTGMKAAEEALRQVKVELEVRVADRTRELVHSQEQLRAFATELTMTEQRERRHLATELHDHLAQMLVLSKLNLAKMKKVPHLPQSCAELIKQTQDVLSEALTYTRTLVAELTPPVLQEFGLPVALKWLGEHMKRHELDVSVQIEGQEDRPLPEAQAVLMFQSVRELLINAAKHAKSRHATISLAIEGHELRIVVRDCGVGFEPASTLSGPVTESSSKFGLFSIRERMRAIGGAFQLHSAPGEGTTATLSLPLNVARKEKKPAEDSGERGLNHPEPSPVGVAADLQAAPRSHAHIPVLLVDDHPMVRQGLRNLLESYSDIEVVGEAWNGEEAMEYAGRLRPAIVVMDINMPKKNGVEATAQITSRYPGIIIIGLSVEANPEIQEAMSEAGAAMLLTKEAAVDELYQAIKEQLEARRSRS